MLSQNEMVKARAAIEKLYDRHCFISENKSYIKDNGTTGQRWEVVHENIPCRISFSKGNYAESTDKATILLQPIKLIINPEIKIKPGSRIRVVKGKLENSFESAGLPAIYDTHQEIVVKEMNFA